MSPADYGLAQDHLSYTCLKQSSTVKLQPAMLPHFCDQEPLDLQDGKSLKLCNRVQLSQHYFLLPSAVFSEISYVKTKQTAKDSFNIDVRKLFLRLQCTYVNGLLCIKHISWCFLAKNEKAGVQGKLTEASKSAGCSYAGARPTFPLFW